MDISALILIATTALVALFLRSIFSNHKEGNKLEKTRDTKPIEALKTVSKRREQSACCEDEDSCCKSDSKEKKKSEKQLGSCGSECACVNEEKKGSTSTPSKKLKILFGTQTGTAKYWADTLAKDAQSRNWNGVFYRGEFVLISIE